ncbi:hypothetical protein BT69DRAFT_1321602 [Atractiella rhizophila]|nr:hypothetical protein BT69DRAFT_1321602 [Atractiella rhizophila]
MPFVWSSEYCPQDQLPSHGTYFRPPPDSLTQTILDTLLTKLTPIFGHPGPKDSTSGYYSSYGTKREAKEVLKCEQIKFKKVNWRHFTEEPLDKQGEHSTYTKFKEDVKEFSSPGCGKPAPPQLPLCTAHPVSIKREMKLTLLNAASKAGSEVSTMQKNKEATAAFGASGADNHASSELLDGDEKNQEKQERNFLLQEIKKDNSLTLWAIADRLTQKHGAFTQSDIVELTRMMPPSENLKMIPLTNKLKYIMPQVFRYTKYYKARYIHLTDHKSNLLMRIIHKDDDIYVE